MSHQISRAFLHFLQKGLYLTRPESTFTLQARLNYFSITDTGSFC